MLRDLKLYLLLRLDAARRAIARRLLDLRFAETIAVPLSGMVLVKTHRHHEAWLDYREARRLARKLSLLADDDEPPAASEYPAGPHGPRPVNRVSAYAAAAHPCHN